MRGQPEVLATKWSIPRCEHRPGELGACLIPTLWAVSAMGTKLSFYHLEVVIPDVDIVPHAIARQIARVNDAVPESSWNYDILEPAGEQKFRQVVDQIKAACARLS